MNVKFINLLEGTISVLKTMAGGAARRKPYMKMDNLAKGTSRNHPLTDPPRLAGAELQRGGDPQNRFQQLGENIKSVNTDIKDAVGETTNMIQASPARTWRRRVSTSRRHSHSGSGKSHSITHVMGGPSLIIPLKSTKDRSS